jgi:hypothetical protein
MVTFLGYVFTNNSNGHTISLNLKFYVMKRRLFLIFSLIIGLASCKKEQSQSFNQMSGISNQPTKTVTGNKAAARGGGAVPPAQPSRALVPDKGKK